MRITSGLTTALVLAVVVSTTAFIGSGCGDGKFAGPPQGSVSGSPGIEPLFGVTVFTFYAENPLTTGFYNDVWYIDPGRDSDEGPGGVIGVWYADSIQMCAIAGFPGWITGDQSPAHIEVNNLYPMMLSFMSQWFHRNPDGSRIRERDQFGYLTWSSKSLDINFVTGPVELIVRPGPQFVYEVWRFAYPAGSEGSIMFGWSPPAATSPGDFPPPQVRFLNKQFSELGTVLLTKMLQSGQPQLTQAMGVTINDNPDNENVENMGAIPQDAGGGFTAVASPTGCFGDLYGLEFSAAPVVQATTPGHDVVEAVVELARHYGALHTNLLVQAIGLNSGEQGSLTDPAQVIFQNGYGYSFVQKDLEAMVNQHLPGKKRDPFAPINP